MNARSLRCASSLVWLVLVLCSGRAVADVDDVPMNVGLNPTQPLTALGVSASETVLTATAKEAAQTFDVRVAFGKRSELRLQLPFYNRLSIAGVGTASGTGDPSAAYTYVFSHGGERFEQAASLALSIGSGNANFSAGRTLVTPSYTFSYRLGPRTCLVLIPSYTFGTTPKAGFSRTQTLALNPYAIFNLTRSGAYAALSTQWQRVRGDYRYDSSEASVRIGDLFERRYNIAAFFATPLGGFSYAHRMHSSFGLTFQVQRDTR